MLTDAYLQRLDALRLAMQHAVRGGAGGIRRSRSLGASAEFSDFREYVPGDDIRRLDWNAYARFDRLFMKLFTEEQESVVTVLMDGSASMAAKRDDAIRAAQALSYLALTGGDRLRIVWLQEDGLRKSPLYAGRRAYPQAAALLKEAPMIGATSLLASLRRIDPFPRGMSFLISDGYQEGGLDPALDLLRYRKQEAAFIHVLSAGETKPALEGALRLKDAENAPDLELLMDAATLQQYQQTLSAFLRDCRAACRKRGMAYLLLDGQSSFEEAFLPALSRSGVI